MTTPLSFGTLLLPLAGLLHSAVAAESYVASYNQTPKDNNPNCSCYVVNSGANSQSPQYFQYYRFYDFRNLAGAYTEAPALINSTANATTLTYYQPGIFNSDAWNSDWSVQNWSKEATEDFPVPMSNSFASVYIGAEQNTSYLSLRTQRQKTYQIAAEIENNQKNLKHVSMRMYGRVKGDKGAVAGFFTFYDDNNESDIEILTRDNTDKIHYTNQPSLDKNGNEVVQASSTVSSLPKWTDWQTHRIDWLSKNTYWYLNQKQVAANTYSVPRQPSFMVLNMWSDGGEWSGNMTTGASAEFQIQWIEMTFNTSGPYEGKKSSSKRSLSNLGIEDVDKRDIFKVGTEAPKDSKRDIFKVGAEKRKSKGCVTVCKIDDVEQIGTPEIVYVGSASGINVSWGLLALISVVSLLVAS